MMVASASLGFVACSNDDDIPAGNPADNINEVFPNGMIKSITRHTPWDDTEAFISDITRDKNGRVVSIKYCGEPYEISYSSNFVKVTTYEYDDYDVRVPYVRTFSLGKNGFINGCTENEGIGVFSFNLEYDAKGYIISRTDSYSDGDGGYGRSKTTVTYNEAGDITRVVIKSEGIDEGIERETTSVTTVEYTNSTVTKAIENKGGIMLYDEIFDIDFDYDVCLFYAGLLGKAPAHLPLLTKQKVDYVYGDENSSYESSNEMSWTLNGNGLPSLLTLVYKYTDDDYDIEDYETVQFNFNW